MMITQNSALNAADSMAFSAQASEKSRASKVNALWLRGAVYGFAIATITMFFGLVISFSVWSQHLYLSDSPLGAVSTTLILASFALFFTGSYCLDKAYEPIYKRDVAGKAKTR